VNIVRFTSCACPDCKPEYQARCSQRQGHVLLSRAVGCERFSVSKSGTGGKISAAGKDYSGRHAIVEVCLHGSESSPIPFQSNQLNVASGHQLTLVQTVLNRSFNGKLQVLFGVGIL
jgi:hypothetical protein